MDYLWLAQNDVAYNKNRKKLLKLKKINHLRTTTCFFLIITRLISAKKSSYVASGLHLWNWEYRTVCEPYEVSIYR